MSSIVIPADARPTGARWFDMSIELDDATFFLEFAWNDADAGWWLSIKDADEVLLLRRRVSVGVPLTAQFRDPSLPAGEMVALDTTGQDLDPTLDDLGTRVQLVYTPYDDLPAGFKAAQ